MKKVLIAMIVVAVAAAFLINSGINQLELPEEE